MPKLPSPCIDVCKHRRGGHCIGCSMTEVQKRMAKSLGRPDQRAAFVALIWHQQQRLGGYAHWLPAYQRKCRRKGVAWEPPAAPAASPAAAG